MAAPNTANHYIDRISALSDQFRSQIVHEDTRCYLIKRGGQTQKFFVVKELEKGWQMEFDDYRGEMLLKVADSDSEFPDLISQVSYIAYGIPDSDDQIEVYSIDPDQRDFVVPTGSSPMWSLYCSKETNERFTVTL